MQQISDPQEKPERRNLALQLNQAKPLEQQDHPPSAAVPHAQEPLLEQAPESERSDAFSIPISEGDASARH